MTGPIEWRDTSQRADQVLTMVAAILLDRAGGRVEFTHDEWIELNRRFGGMAAVMFTEPEAGEPFRSWIGTVGEVAQQGRGAQA